MLSQIFSIHQPAKKYFVIIFLISCCLLEIFTFVIYQQSRVSDSFVDGIIRNYDIIQTSRLAMMATVDLENKEQVFLTHYTPSSPPFDATTIDLDRNLQHLRSLSTINIDQAQNIINLCIKIEGTKNLILSHIQKIEGQNINPDLTKRFLDETVQITNETRPIYRGLVGNVNSVLEQNIARAKKGRENHLWTLAMGDILGLGALLIANIVIFMLIGGNTRTEQDLRKNKELFAKVLDGIHDGVFDYNVQKGTIYYSTSYQKMLGYSAEELSAWHKDFSHLVHPDDVDQAREVVQRYINKESKNLYSIFRVRHKNGHWIWVMSRGLGIWDDKGKIERIIGTHTDISVQKQHEEELNYFIKENERQQALLGLAIEKADAANQAKSDFLATVSHEIRTPMNAVIGLAHILLTEQLAPKHHEMVETLHVNADILLKLVNDLLDISRIEAQQIELESHSLTFEDVFKSLYAMFNNQALAKNIHLQLTNHLGNQNFLGDMTRIQQILVNLINNALKFTPQGTISISASGEDKEDGVTLVRLTVSDTGVGIPPEKLDAVFEKFVQADQTISRRYGGSGLGLAICKSLAGLMGGDIMVSSLIDQGSIFTLILPLRVAKLKKPSKTSEMPAVTHGRHYGKVLVVEDYAANVMVATLMLENLGYEVEAASSGAEALLKIREITTPYTAILMDVQMQNMDGYETTRRIRKLELEKNMHHFIIGVTAHALAGDRDKCLDAGMDDYMSKPINFSILAQKLKMVSEAA